MAKDKKQSDGGAATLPVPTPRMKTLFQDTVADEVRKQFGIDNVMATPKLDKIILNVGMGNQIEGTKLNATAKEQVLSDLELISGQKAVTTRAIKSVANFKVREGYENGAMVTLRGDRMWEFFDRLVTLAIPRIKDFRGLKDKSFDGRGNYSFGITEQGIFPEIDMAHAKFSHGMHITFVFKNSTNEMSYELLKAMGFPFIRRDENQN